MTKPEVAVEAALASPHAGYESETTDYIQGLMNDPAEFVAAVWKQIGRDSYDPIDDVNREMIWFGNVGRNPADALVVEPKVGYDEPRWIQRIILGPRFCGKSRKITCAGTAYDLFVNPDFRTVIIAKNGKKAKDLISEIKMLIDKVWFLEHLKPDAAKNHRSHADAFDVGPTIRDKEPSVSALGIDGAITGSHGHKLRFDDVEDGENTRTIDARDYLWKRAAEFQYIASFGHAEIVGVATVHHEETVNKRLVAEGYEAGGYQLRTYPVTPPRPETQITNIAPVIQAKIDAGEIVHGESCFPGSHSQEKIARFQAATPREFLMHMMCSMELADSDTYPLRLDQLMIVDEAPPGAAPATVTWGRHNSLGSTRIDDVECLGFSDDALHKPAIMDPQLQSLSSLKAFIDPAGKGKDQTAIAIGAWLNGYIWGHEVVGIAPELGFSAPESLEIICNLLCRHRVRECWIEDYAMQAELKPYLVSALKQYRIEPNEDGHDTNGWSCAVEMAPYAAGQKEIRILSALEPAFNQHRLILSQRAIKPCEKSVGYELQHQITRLTRDRGALRHDDKVEALSGLVRLFNDRMAVDPSAAKERRQRRMRDIVLRDRFKGQQRQKKKPGSRSGWIKGRI